MVLLNLSFSVYCFVDHCLYFCLVLLAIVLSVLSFTDSDYLFVIFNLFLNVQINYSALTFIVIFIIIIIIIISSFLIW